MPRVINLSEATSLAVHALVIMAGDKDSKFSTQKLAGILSASEHHLSKVMQRLVKNGIISSVRGPKGGFQIVKALDKVNLLTVYEIFEGKIDKKFCLFSNPVCKNKNCMFGGFLQQQSDKLYDYLTNTTLQDFAD